MVNEEIIVMAKLLFDSGNSVNNLNFKLRGYDCVMIKHEFICGYIGLTQNHKYFNEEYYNIPCNVNLSFSGSSHFLPQYNEKNELLHWIGFDMANFWFVNAITKCINYKINYELAFKWFGSIIEDISK